MKIKIYYLTEIIKNNNNNNNNTILYVMNKKILSFLHKMQWLFFKLF